MSRPATTAASAEGAWRRVMRRLRGADRSLPRWSLHGRMFDQAVLLVQVYYVISLFMLYRRAREMAGLGRSSAQLDALWPIKWVELTGPELGGALMAHLAIGAGLLGMLFWRRLWVRVLVSLALLQYVALNNSFGFMGHGFHSWFWLSVAFWFLPSGSPQQLRETRRGRFRFLLGFSAAPAVMLLFYSLSGCYKLVAAIVALFTEDASGLAPQAMAMTLAWRTFETGSEPFWAPLIIELPWLGWPLYLGLYYIEVVALVVLLRPRLHQSWGVLLILFHVGTFFFMDITFPEHVLINGLLLVMSPFALGLHDPVLALRALPVIGWLFRPLDRRLRWSTDR
jgi:hypothetical protein